MTILLIIVTVLAVGGVVLLFADRIKSKHRSFSTFSAALVATLIFVHILPDIYGATDSMKWMGVALLVGLVLQLVLEKVTHGVEHVHDHSHAKNHKSILIGVMLGLCCHAFIEGMPMAIEETASEVVDEHSHEGHNHEGGHEHNHEDDHSDHSGHDHVDYSDSKGVLTTKFISAVLMHKVPVTIMLSLFLLSVGVKRTTFFILLSVFALMTPLGMLSGKMLMGIPQINAYKYYLLALSTGMLLHIITSILFEHGHSKKETNFHILLILVGIVVGIFLF